MSKKILIINQNSGYLTIDVANAFAEEYDEVVVMHGLNKVTERTFNPKIRIQKTIHYNRSSSFMRLLTWIICTLNISFLLLWRYRGYKVLYYSNPPMSYFNALVFSNVFGLVVFDTYPDSLKLIGISENSFLYRIWARINRLLFNRAAQIVTLSNGMKKELLKYAAAERIKVVPVWSASENFRPIKKIQNMFLAEHNWQDKFIILYSGNMGFGHSLEVLIDVAEALSKKKDILFLFIGEGAKKKVLQQMSKDKNLDNVEFLTWQSAEVLPFSLASADIAVVALEPDATNASVPSKTFNYMAVGAPLLAIGNPGSELEKMIQTYGVGYYAKGGDVAELVSFIDKMYSDRDKLHYYSDRSFETSKIFNFRLCKDYLF